MCADIEIVTSNQYDGPRAAHAQLGRSAPRLRSALPRPHVRLHGTPAPSAESVSSGSGGGGRLRSGSALPPDLLVDGPTRQTRLSAHGVRGQAERAKGSVSSQSLGGPGILIVNPFPIRIRRVELLIEPGQSLGLMIRGGVEYGLGIFVTGVDKDSVADRSGLMIGDEILEVNGQSFLDVTHDEAVGQLKYHKRMSLVIRDVGKVPHSCTSIEMEPWDAYSPTGTRWVILGHNSIRTCFDPLPHRARRKGQIATMVEEKARSLLPRHHFASLSYYIAEYSAKAMTIDAFVAVLLEMLDTYEKVGSRLYGLDMV